ncbi:ABC transporter permease subunit [Rhodohalobacter sulfatireducens]|uniref:ABC transporter permease n=1 Tax=Rhodohalobacter sulfatireducens TaxID=2911366 RepID=A0ABS9KCI6_9BACT|nr:ABC transporter permease subunit [Rhodohalobacter sulfatireducens]MCG2588556.1 ABC transporter permease [Rhodohalobacter sulfatireducens]
MIAVYYQIVRNEFQTLLRARWLIGYGLIFLLLTDTLFRFTGGGAEVLVSLSNVILLFIPLISMLYGILFIYQSRDYLELLLTQPVNRETLYWGLFTGISGPLTSAFLAGTTLPLIWHGNFSGEPAMQTVLVLGIGAILTFIFTGLGFVMGLAYYEEKIKGFGYSLMIWLFMAVIYDGLILLLIFLLGDYPIETGVVGLTMLNPIDLGRILILLEFDISALMGYTGAVFSQFLGSLKGMLTASFMLVLWLILPMWLGLRLFRKKDF